MKVRAVQEWPVLADVTAFRSVLGLALYYRRYCPCFADVAAPLYHLTQEGVPFVWEVVCEQAFRLLKDLLITAPVLAYSQDGASAFILHADTSDGGLGAVLEQDGRVVANASCALTQPTSFSGCCLLLVHCCYTTIVAYTP